MTDLDNWEWIQHTFSRSEASASAFELLLPLLDSESAASWFSCSDMVRLRCERTGLVRVR